MVDVQAISVTIASAGVFLAAMYYILQLRHQNRVRQTDLIIRLYSVAGSREFLEAWEEIKNRRIESVSDYRERYGSFVEISRVNTVLGELGMLLQRKLIDTDLIDDLTGGIETIAWEKLKPINDYIKKQRGIESDSFDYLYNEMKKREPQGAKNG